MPSKIYHKDQGFVLTGNDNEIKEILSRGGVIIQDSMSMDELRQLITQRTEVVKEIKLDEQVQQFKSRGRPRKWP